MGPISRESKNHRSEKLATLQFVAVLQCFKFSIYGSMSNTLLLVPVSGTYEAGEQIPYI